jgi:hypothetical protein
MNPLDMMFRSGVMSEWRPARRWQERRMLNEMLKDVEPRDDTPLIGLIVGGIVFTNVFLFVRWWMG